MQKMAFDNRHFIVCCRVFRAISTTGWRTDGKRRNSVDRYCLSNRTTDQYSGANKHANPDVYSNADKYANSDVYPDADKYTNSNLHTNSGNPGRKAAVHGNPKAMVNLGYCYCNGIGIKENPAIGIEWYIKAKEAGNEVALFNLGMCYKAGYQLEKNITEAIECFQSAGNKGQRCDL